ncbi:MAG: glycosyltransferase family 39 protein, partial [Polyangia bacterium]
MVLVAVLLFWGAALYGIRSPFYYGHYGYHGGSYATWARGTLRHHTLLPVNEPGFAPPRPGTYYIHHPVLTHQLVTLTFLLFGEHEWSIRLAGLLPAFASLLLVAAIAWRYLGPLAGAVAALTFAVVPVNIWYSVNIDQGFPSIACLLAFFWFYLRWLETGRWSVAWAALAFQALAGGFEWSPYFAFPAVFAHVAWTAFRRRGRYLSFAWL